MPKAFISYSWTTAEHIEWVKKLGQDLMESGVEIILDNGIYWKVTTAMLSWSAWSQTQA